MRIILINVETVLIKAHAGQNRLSQENVPSLPDRELLPQDTRVKEDTPKMLSYIQTCIQTLLREEHIHENITLEQYIESCVTLIYSQRYSWA